jgi:hypothetical protein
VYRPYGCGFDVRQLRVAITDLVTFRAARVLVLAGTDRHSDYRWHSERMVRIEACRRTRARSDSLADVLATELATKWRAESDHSWQDIAASEPQPVMIASRCSSPVGAFGRMPRSSSTLAALLATKNTSTRIPQVTSGAVQPRQCVWFLKATPRQTSAAGSSVKHARPARPWIRSCVVCTASRQWQPDNPTLGRSRIHQQSTAPRRTSRPAPSLFVRTHLRQGCATARPKRHHQRPTHQEVHHLNVVPPGAITGARGAFD